MLPIAASTFCQFFLFLYAGPEFPFAIEEIDNPDRSDCAESSQEEVSRGLSNFGGLFRCRVEHFGGLLESCLLKTCSTLSTLELFLRLDLENLRRLELRRL